MDTAVPNILEVLRHFDKTRAKRGSCITGENAFVEADQYGIYAMCYFCIACMFPFLLILQQPVRAMDLMWSWTWKFQNQNHFKLSSLELMRFFMYQMTDTNFNQFIVSTKQNTPNNDINWQIHLVDVVFLKQWIDSNLY